MRHRVVVAVPAGGAGLATGCCSAARGPGHATASAARALTTEQGDANILSFTRCMRSHGVQMSDPVHHPGHAVLSIDLPERGPATSAAYAACTHFIQAIIQA